MKEKWLLLGVTAVLGGFGLAAFAAGWMKNRPDLVQAGGAVVAASLVALAGGLGFTSWAEERRRARIEKQQTVYTELVEQLMSRFRILGGYNAAREATLRAQVATWGEHSVVQALGGWHSTYDEVVPQNVPPGSTVTVPNSSAARMELATAEVVKAVRRSIASDDDTEVEEIIRALFNRPNHQVNQLGPGAGS